MDISQLYETLKRNFASNSGGIEIEVRAVKNAFRIRAAEKICFDVTMEIYFGVEIRTIENEIFAANIEFILAQKSYFCIP